MMACPCTPGAASRSISSSTACRVGRAAATVALNGRSPSGPRAAGLMAMAVRSRTVSASPASVTSLANCDAARGEKKVTASSARACSAARAEFGQRRSPRGRRRGRSAAPRSRRPAATRRDRAPRRRPRHAAAGPPWDRDAGAPARPGPSPSPAAEVTALKPSPSAVVAVVSPTARIGRPRCSLASASARAPLALVSRMAWQAASDAAKSPGGWRMSRRNSGAMTGTWPRWLSAVASAIASRSGRVISTRISFSVAGASRRRNLSCSSPR